MNVTAIYNGYTIPNIFGKFYLHESYTEVAFSCEFLILSSSEANLVTACNTAEAALREWNKDFTLQFGGTAEYSFSHAGATGFLAQPSLDKITNEFSTVTSRPYKFSVSIKRPADQSGYDYRQEGEISLDQPTNARRQLTVNGKYTAGVVGTAKTAKQNYDTYGPTWADSIADSLLGSSDHELVSSHISYEQENKILSFSRRYQEKLNISVVYNGYTIPSSYNNFTLTETYETLSFSCEFALAHADAAAAEAALRVYNADMTMSFGGSPMYSYKHSDNTGFLSKPTLTLISNTADDDSLRFYRFSMVCQLPADKAGYSYRREGSFTIRYTPARRRSVHFTMVYTAGTSDALTMYNNAGKTWAASVLTSVGGTYELLAEDLQVEQEKKLATANLTYQEILAKESESSLSVANIVNAECTYEVSFGEEYGLDSTGGFSAVPPVTVTVHYAAQLDSAAVSSETGLDDVYRSTVRPWIIKHAYDVLGLESVTQAGQNYIAQNESYNINPHTYNVSGTISFAAPRTTEQIVLLSESLSLSKFSGIVYRKLWDGKDDTYNIYSIGGRKTMRRTLRVLQYSTEPKDPTPLGDKWLRLNFSRSQEVKMVGVGGPSGSVLREIKLYQTNFNEDYLFAEATV